jgi:flagellar hook-basal body complex protein FliE
VAVDPIGFLPAASPIAEPGAAQPGQAAGAGDFGAWLAQSLERVDGDLARAGRAMQSLATGDAQSLHQVMVALEEARIGVQLAVQVRNRMLDAYQEVLRMQI